MKKNLNALDIADEPPPRAARNAETAAAVAVGLPLLELLPERQRQRRWPRPVRRCRSAFGTWQWGLGMSEAVFVPKKTGANFDLPPRLRR